MRKFYTFTAGQQVPSWMFNVDFKGMGAEDLVYNSHHGVIIFGRSCIAVRGDAETYTKIMPCGNNFGDKGVIIIKRFRNAVMGGVAGATGVCIGPEGCGVAHISASR